MISKDRLAPIILPESQTIFRDRTDVCVRIKPAFDGGFQRCGSHGRTRPAGMMDASESGRLRDVARMVVRTGRRASIRLPHSFVRQRHVTAWSGPLRRQMKRRSETLRRYREFHNTSRSLESRMLFYHPIGHQSLDAYQFISPSTDVQIRSKQPHFETTSHSYFTMKVTRRS